MEVLRAASVPYLAMIEQWLYRGKVVDPYHEFCIHERLELQSQRSVATTVGGAGSRGWTSAAAGNVRDTLSGGDTYWDTRFTLRPAQLWYVAWGQRNICWCWLWFSRKQLRQTDRQRV